MINFYEALHCDPAPHITEHTAIITPEFIKEISPLAKIEIYVSTVTIQRGMGCSYFSIDGARMLATPSDRAYTSHVIEYVVGFVKDKDILDPVFLSQVKQYKIDGLVKFCEEKIVLNKKIKIR